MERDAPGPRTAYAVDSSVGGECAQDGRIYPELYPRAGKNRLRGNAAYLPGVCAAAPENQQDPA